MRKTAIALWTSLIVAVLTTLPALADSSLPILTTVTRTSSEQAGPQARPSPAST